MLVKGGNYNFNHCTAATFSSNFIQHREPILALTNYLNNNAANLNATFRNCIFWGEANGIVDDEVIGDPEATPTNQNNDNSAFSQGIIWHGYPRPRTFMVGINIGI